MSGDLLLETGYKSSAEQEYNQFVIGEQRSIQGTKIKDRLVSEYDLYLFPGINLFGDHTYTSTTEDFLRKKFSVRFTGLAHLLETISARRGRPANWSDMGGGHAMAMRELRLDPVLGSRVQMTNVDSIRHSLDSLSAEDRDYIAKKHPGIFEPRLEPRFIQSNTETVTLPEPQDVITSVESIQYLNNPLMAICDWYNQLRNGGLLLISAEHPWATWIRYIGSSLAIDPHPIEPFMATLKENGIKFAGGSDTYKISPRGNPFRKNNEFLNMVIVKKPDTFLYPRAQVRKILANKDHFKVVYYGSEEPLIEVRSVKTEQETGEDYYRNMLALAKAAEK